MSAGVAIVSRTPVHGSVDGEDGALPRVPLLPRLDLLLLPISGPVFHPPPLYLGAVRGPGRGPPPPRRRGGRRAPPIISTMPLLDLCPKGPHLSTVTC